jgi:FkbM family methyltransferase
VSSESLIRRAGRRALAGTGWGRNQLASRQRQRGIAFYGGFLAPGSRCFDIGANVGDRTAIFRQTGARTIAVEPQRACLRALERRFADDPDVVVVPMAVGSEPGSAEIAVCDEDSTISTMSSQWRTEGRFADRKWDRTESVPVTTLDRLIEAHGRPDFCKIDVEGFERRVLEGLTSPLPCVSFEFTREFIDDARACTALLEALGPVAVNASIGESMRLIGGWDRQDRVFAGIEAQPAAADWGDVYVRSL